RQTRHDNSIARQLIAKAIEIDPNYAEAYLWMSVCCVDLWLDDLDGRQLEQAIQLAHRAVELDENSPRCNATLGYATLYNRDFAVSEFHHFRAAALNPNDAHIATHVGLFLSYTDRIAEARKWFSMGMALNPLPPSWYFLFHGIAGYIEGKYEDAVKLLNS